MAFETDGQNERDIESGLLKFNDVYNFEDHLKPIRFIGGALMMSQRALFIGALRGDIKGGVTTYAAFIQNAVVFAKASNFLRDEQLAELKAINERQSDGSTASLLIKANETLEILFRELNHRAPTTEMIHDDDKEDYQEADFSNRGRPFDAYMGAVKEQIAAIDTPAIGMIEQKPDDNKQDDTPAS